MRTIPHGTNRGMTLIEMLVSMVVLTILGSAIAAVMVSQVKSASSVQGQAMVQSDVNLALSMIRSDVTQAGYGNASDELALASAAGVGGDSLTMTGSNVGAGAGRWTVADQTNSLSGTGYLVVRRWTGADSINNIKAGDSIKVISGLKELIGRTKATVVNHLTSTTDQLTLATGLSIGKGSLVSQVNTNVTGTGFTAAGQVNYSLNPATRQLLRNGLPFMDNVEDFEVRYFWDKNGDGTIDSSSGEYDDALTVNVSPSLWNYRPMLIGVAFVTVSPIQEGAMVDGRTSYTIWGKTTNISALMQRHYRNFYSLYIRPRNIGG